MSCPPAGQPICPPICPPPAPPPPCRPKPLMRGLHWSQTTSIMTIAFALSATAGTCMYLFNGRPRIAAYKDFHAKTEFGDWGEEMAKKGLFQAVPVESLKDFPNK